MTGLTAMRRTGQSEFFVAKSKKIGTASFHQYQSLQRLDRGARKNRRANIAERQNQAAVSVDDCNSAAMPAFDLRSSNDFDQNRIVHLQPSDNIAQA